VTDAPAVEERSPVRPGVVKLRLTPAGKALAIFAAAMLALSWATQGVLGLYAAAGTALLAVIPLLAWLHARGARLLPPAPVTAFAGETFPLDIEVLNFGHVLALRDVVLLHRSDRRDVERPAGYAATVPPRASRCMPTAQRLLRRGRHRELTVALESSFPLALALARLEFTLETDILVLPRLGTVRNLDALTAHRHGLLYQGMADRGDEQEFHGMREWREGESLRRVHWRHSARRGRLLVREFRGEDRPPIHVVLDARIPPRRRTSSRRGSFERAVSLAATLTEQHLRRQHLVRFTILGEQPLTFERSRGRSALFPVLQALAEIEPSTLAGPRTLEFATRRDEVTLVVCAGGTRDVLDVPGVRVLDVERQDVSRMFVRSRPAGSMRLLGKGA
jgi:uncharacterized protein (DUF58 family)